MESGSDHSRTLATGRRTPSSVLAPQLVFTSFSQTPQNHQMKIKVCLHVWQTTLIQSVAIQRLF